MKKHTIITTLLILVIIIGIFFRFYKISENNFVYYDEGLYLAHNIDFQYYVQKNPPQNIQTWFRYIEILFHIALTDAKALWFFLCASRSLIFGPEAWFFPRLLSAIFGTLTIGMTYILARRFYRSNGIALLSAGILALLPSHIYYSRLGMQEGLSTFCFVTGIYFYLHSNRLNYRTFLSSFFFACLFFTSYRMIITPVLVGLTEMYLSFAEKRAINFRKWIYNTLAFLFIIFLVGNIDDGANTRITFGWMFRQAHLAEGSRDVINFFSYPYYLFKLESLIFGLGFFACLYYFIKRKANGDQGRLLWAYPFVLACFHMALFSFAQEKGVRYLCVMLPFICMSVASIIVSFSQTGSFPNINFAAVIIIVVVGLMFIQHGLKSIQIINYKSDYENSVVQLPDSAEKYILSTQPLIHKMFAGNRRDVMPLPHQWNQFLAYYKQGFRYVMLDPQAYISYTQDGQRFSPPLKTFVKFIDRFVSPFKVYPHFRESLLERFVLEHNVHLPTTLNYLKGNKDGRLGLLKVYKVNDCLSTLGKYIRLNELHSAYENIK